MAEEKKETSYEVFRETVDEYSEHKGDDLLTDPMAMAAAARKEEQASVGRHGENLRAAARSRGSRSKSLLKRPVFLQTRLVSWRQARPFCRLAN